MSFLRPQVTSTLVQNEVPGGSVNSSNTAFTTASNMATGSLRVYRNGVRLKGGGVDFTQGSNNAFTMVTAPITNDLLLVDYNVYNSALLIGTNSTISSEVPTGTIDGLHPIFTTARAYIAGSLEVYIDGIHQTRGTDYTETTPASGTFTMATAPNSPQVVTVNYQFNLNPSSNSDTVDGIHASATPTANQLLALDSNSQFPQSVIKTGAATNSVATSQSTTSTSYTDLTTTGPAATVTIGPNGLALVTVTSQHWSSASAIDVYNSFAASGANTVAAVDINATSSNGTPGVTSSATTLLTGLTAGSTTFTSKYRTTSGTANFANRSISVVPL